ncbi:macro domain-containing protein [Patescibacteria group bacterium]|nr:macro domain-containing protein [Patescibacteria group bacterium]
MPRKPNPTNISKNQESYSEFDSKIIQEAKEIILDNGRVSISLLQRKLRIGFAKASHIINKLKEEKFLGPYDPKIKTHTILAKNYKPKKTRKYKTLKKDTPIYSAAPHTERDFDWEIESIRRQYRERIDFLMKSDKTEEEKQKEKQILIENSYHDPRLPSIFYEKEETAKEMRKIARRLDSITKEDFLTIPYVLDWSQNKPNTITWVFPVRGDITKIEVDAIVNPTDHSLAGDWGLGPNLSIHIEAGPELFDECMKIRDEKYPLGLPTGEAIITKGYNLPSKYVIHTVGPAWMGGYGREEELLYKCYFNSLLLAKENNIKIIAFPDISASIYGYPKQIADQVSNKAISDFCAQYRGAIEEIVQIVP